MQRVRYAIHHIGQIPGVKVPFAAQVHFNEFVVNFDQCGKSVSQVNAALLRRGIFGGKDLSTEFPELGESMLVCITEIHSQEDIESLVSALQEVVR
jgi:glycine dehydrogenase subunit 1